MPALLASASKRVPAPGARSTTYVSLFPTEIGWFGLLGHAEGLSRIVFAHATPQATLDALGPDAIDAPHADWNPQLRQLLEDYASGKPVHFKGVKIIRPRPLTPFQQRVVDIVQEIPRGETLTYGEVACLAGSPGAARAVGQVMRTNPVPIVVPCHRVVGSSGGLGGFSAAGGVRTKQWMLDIESDSPRG